MTYSSSAQGLLCGEEKGGGTRFFDEFFFEFVFVSVFTELLFPRIVLLTLKNTKPQFENAPFSMYRLIREKERGKGANKGKKQKKNTLLTRHRRRCSGGASSGPPRRSLGGSLGPSPRP